MFYAFKHLLSSRLSIISDLNYILLFVSYSVCAIAYFSCLNETCNEVIRICYIFDNAYNCSAKVQINISIMKTART